MSSYGRPELAQRPPFFVVGCARSGTTLLRDLLRAHPRIFMGHESFFLPWLLVLHGNPASEPDAVKLGASILRYLRKRNFATDLRPEDFAHCRSYRAAAELPFRRAAEREGRARWGDKTPIYVEHIPTIRQIFPGSKFVHVVRDGRDVARSLVGQHFGPNTVFAAAATWRRRVEFGMTAERQLGDDVVHRVRYEELVNRPEPVLRELLGFLEEPFDAAVLTPSPIDPVASQTLSTRRPKPPVPEPGINPGHAFKWRSSMSHEAQVVFESVAGETLVSLGYETFGLGQTLAGREKLRWRLEDQARSVWNRFRSGGYDAEYFTQLRVRWKMRRAQAGSGSVGR